jgi:hypothetical protein
MEDGGWWTAGATLCTAVRRPIASYIASEPIRGGRTNKSGRNGRICGGTLFIDNVGINKSVRSIGLLK